MRIYTNPFEAAKETERDLFEMGIDVHPQTMQDKDVRDNDDYITKEVRGYSFKIVNWVYSLAELRIMMKHFFPVHFSSALTYVLSEFRDRTSGKALNPGNSYKCREVLWTEFMHDGKFSYTYSERMEPQLEYITNQLKINPETRQAIINIHTNICPEVDRTIPDTAQDVNHVCLSADLYHTGGKARIPCSMYYQIMIREGRVDLIYTMRSCDLLIHFPIDISLALCLLDYFADILKLKHGTFTYFTGSLHAYKKDMINRGIF